MQFDLCVVVRFLWRVVHFRPAVRWFFLCVCCTTVLMAAKPWEAVPLEDLQAKDSKVFPGADVEILLSTEDFDEGSYKVETDHFIRAKIYTQLGVEKKAGFSTIYFGTLRPIHLAGRVVKPDGHVIELKETDFIDQEVVRNWHGAGKQLTFVFPDLEVGDVVEYRWRDYSRAGFWVWANFCQSSFPIREYRFNLMNLMQDGAIGWLNCAEADCKTNKKEEITVTMRNLPAFVEEPFMPPSRQYCAWIYITKTFPIIPNDADVWEYLSERWSDEFESNTRPRKSLTAKAAELCKNIEPMDEKLRKLYEYCQNNFLNTSYKVTESSRVQVDKHKEEDALPAQKILAQGYGRKDEINVLFAALARSLGCEVRIARYADTSELMGVKMPRSWAFMHNECVAVKVGEGWKFFDPGTYFMPYGYMGQNSENATALICGMKQQTIATIPVSSCEMNTTLRKAKLSLNEQGVIEGDMELIHNGHPAIDFKAKYWDETMEKVNKDFMAEIAKQLPAAEVTAITWDNLQSNQMPLSVKYHIRIPGYASKAGKRLVIGPSVFQSGKVALFTKPDRKYPIYFPYPFSEKDVVEINLPDGYELERPSSPPSAGDIGIMIGTRYDMQYNRKTHTLGYQREYAVGVGGACNFKQESYPILKEIFERIHASDNHMLMLKPKKQQTANGGAPEKQ